MPGSVVTRSNVLRNWRLAHAVDPLDLLLLAQLLRVLRRLAAARRGLAVLAGRVRTALDRALLGEALRALEEQLRAFAAALAAAGSGIARHGSDPPLLGRTAAVVRNRRHVLDRLRPGARPTASAWMADSRPLPGPCTRTCTRRTPEVQRLARACSAATVAANGVDFLEPLKPALPDDAPRDGVAAHVGDRDDRVVERRADVGDALGLDDLLGALGACGAFAGVGAVMLLLGHLLLAGDRAARTLLGARVGVRALAADREARGDGGCRDRSRCPSAA